MQLTVQQVFDATQTVAAVIREKRPLPVKGSYRLARMHAALEPEFKLIAAKRDALITAYDHHEPDAANFSVPADKADEFNAAWATLAAETIEVGVEPIPLEQLDGGGVGSINALELIALGDLVRE